MIYDLRHLTRYLYEAPVAANSCALRLTPRSMKGQETATSHIEITPQPVGVAERIDIFGNRVVRMRIEAPHRELVIESTARVRVERPAPPAPALTPSWERVAEDAADAQTLSSESPALALFESRLVGLYDQITDYARSSFPPGRPVYEAGLDLNRRINADFAYDKRVTAVSTPPEVAFAKRGGVCQDFAHIMIAALRGLGLPALYVSGYIRTIPPPGKRRLVGADASHAWVQLWCGREFGWLALDPTNAIAVGDDHIVLAIGRDYADVAPVEGVIVSSGGQTLDVEVDVVPMRR
ncbi:MAG TPA: transglutaminase family protein [Roseiarcus sp.]|jgi:transglutaminase-like putative cysteine protease|nr:transglutaminase family protein [Roseiarcus sp.]